MVDTGRVVREYECVGGPLDGKQRNASPPPALDIIYVVQHDNGNGDLSLVESSTMPPYPGWEVLGYYQVAEDDNARRGTRERLWWHSKASWPIWFSVPWKPDPPPDPDSFNSDPEID